MQPASLLIIKLQLLLPIYGELLGKMKKEKTIKEQHPLRSLIYYG